ncbi:MAG: hypothetical protein WCC01_06270 [Acidimicrobiia bacterium]
MRPRCLPRFVPLVLVVLLLLGCGGNDDDAADTTLAATTTTPPAATEAPVATTRVTSEAPSVDGPVATAGWVQVPASADLSRSDGSQEMNSVVRWDGGFVAVGGDGGEVGRDAAVWVSADGLVWSRVDDPDGLNADGWQTMNTVTTGGPGLVAVGTSAPGLHKDDAAVWTSTDGLRWTRVPDDSGDFSGAGDHHMADVVAGGPGLVAVGSVGSVDTGVAAVWTSQDGLAWTRVAHSDEVFGGDRWQFMASVTVSDSGLVAVGGDSSGDDLDAAVWTSPDGLVWSRVVDTDGTLTSSGDQAMESVTVGGPGLVAVGREKPGSDFDGVVWISSDGGSWTRVDTGDAFGGPGDQAVAQVFEVDGGLMAVGYERSEDRDAQVWDSADGLAWAKSSDPGLIAEGLQEIHSLAASTEWIIAVGYSGDIASTNAAVWHHPN